MISDPTQDATDQKLSEEGFRTLFETMHQGVIFHDANGRITVINRAAERITGLSVGQMREYVGNLTRRWTAREFGEVIGIQNDDSRPLALREDGSEFILETSPATIALRTGQSNRQIVGFYNFAEKDYRWLIVSATPEFRPGEERPCRISATFEDITERKRTEDALAERVKELACLYAVSRDIQEDLSTDELCRRAVENLIPAMQFPEITVPVIELNGMRFTSEDFAERLSQGLHAEIRVEGQVLGHLWVYYLEERPFLIPEEQNLVNGVAGAISTWLERKRAEETLRNALRESEEGKRILSAMMDHIPMGITIADAPDVKIRIVSRYGQLLTQKPPEQIEGISVDQHADKWDIYRADGITPAKNEDLPLTRATQKGEMVREEEWVIGRPDGKKVPILCTAAPILDSKGEITGGVIGWQDITDRKRAEEALKESESRFRTMADHLPLIVWVHDEKGEQQFVNRIFRKFFGITEGESRGSGWQVFMHPDDADAYAEEFYSCVRERRPFHSETRVLAKDGQLRWLESWGQPRFSETGEFLGHVGTSADITDRKIADDSIRRARDELEDRVQERTAELKEMNLELKRSNDALQDFSYMASHDLQEPLRKVQMFGDLLQNRYKSVLDDEGKDWVFRMTSASKRMQALLNALLDYARVTIKAKPFIEVSLNHIIQDVLIDLEARLRETGGTIEAETLPTVKADRSQMEQLIQNLIGNALKFHKESEKPLVKVSSQQREGFYRISISDNGIGFDEQHLEKVFAPFQRLHGREEYEGTGMGLPICKKIVERHGGTITAKSFPGKGSTFIIDLPVKKGRKSP